MAVLPWYETSPKRNLWFGVAVLFGQEVLPAPPLPAGWAGGNSLENHPLFLF